MATIASRLTSTGTLLVNGSFSENIPIGSLDYSVVTGIGIIGGNAFAFGTNNFTIESWVYTRITSSNRLIYDSRPDGTLTEYPLVRLNASDQLTFGVGGSTGGFAFINGTTSFAANTWYHAAVTRQSNLVRLFVNGIQEASATFANTLLNGGSGSTGFAGRPLIGVSGFIYGSNPWQGLLTGIRVINGTAAYTANFTVPQTILPVITNTVLLVNCEGTSRESMLTDQGPNNYSLTSLLVTANTISPYATQPNLRITTNTVYAGTLDELSLPAGAISFNGTTQYLTLANNSSIQLDATNFTIELWVYYSSFSNSPQLLQTATSNTVNLSYSIATTTGGAIRYYLSSNGSSWNVASAISVGTAQLNSWNHVALVRNGTTVTPYLNGVAGTTTTTSATLFAFISALNIGSIGFNLTNNLNGYISNLRIVKGTAVYTSAFIPPQAILPAFATAGATISLLLHFNGTNGSTTFTDSSSNALSVTAGGGAQLSTAQFQFGNASVIFDGTGDSLQLPSSSALDFGTAPFTIEFWMRTDGAQDAFSIIISRTANAPSTGGTQTFGFSNYGGSITVNVLDVDIVTASSATANDGSWHHIAISRDGINMWLGVDGTIVSSNSSMTGSESVTLSSGRIGRWQGNNLNDNNYNGYLDEFRVTKGLALYTTTYTVPTAELSAVIPGTDASLLLNVTDSANFIRDNGPNKFTLTNNGTATFIATGPFNQGSTATAQRQLPDGTLEVYNQFDEFTGAPIVDTSLMVWVDAGQTASYPGSGATWTDLSGNGKNYTLTNTPTYSSTTGGGVITFAGASSQYATTATTLFNSTTFNTYTMNLWVYPTGAGNFVQVDGQTTPNTGYHYSAIEISAAGVIKFGQWIGSMSTIATSTQSLNAWYNLVITYNGTTATAYVNGVSVGSTNIGWSSPGANTFMALMAIDTTNMDTGAYASGSLGAFMVYNRGLSADEISTNFNALRGRYGI